ncbi:MAG: CrcB family protein [Solirubrobacteraceae bacterium]
MALGCRLCGGDDDSGLRRCRACHRTRSSREDRVVTVGKWALVAVLGGTGSIARFLVDGFVGERAEVGQFPWGTFAVNLSGAALLGGLAGAALTENALAVAGTATLGSYTGSASGRASLPPTRRCR